MPSSARSVPIFVACLIVMTGARSETPPASRVSVDAGTLHGRIMCGYQAWFTSAGDRPGNTRWIHWARNHEQPDGKNLTVEMYPDLSEFDPDELFPTGMTLGNRPAPLYSGSAEKTVRRHMRWMWEYGIDGVFVQRFLRTHHGDDTAYQQHMNEALWNVKAGCEEFGRVFAVMYDVSGMREHENWWEVMRRDWKTLVDQGLLEGGRYLHHDGRPVVGIWGFGFRDRVPEDPRVALEVIRWFKTYAPATYRATVFGGVPGHWRTRNGDARAEPDWEEVYRAFDISSPWTVGRYADTDGADRWKRDRLVPDLARTRTMETGYVPVVWPGFSWHNLKGGPKNQIPRAGGHFYWRQIHNAISAGADMLYVAMFDEVDEATAIYKIAATRAQTPDQGYWLTLDADGYELPEDWYLRLTFEAGRMLRRETSLTPTRPDHPGPPSNPSTSRSNK